MNYPCVIVRLDGRSGRDRWRCIFNATEIHVTPHGNFHRLAEVARFFRCATPEAANKEFEEWLKLEGADNE